MALQEQAPTIYHVQHGVKHATLVENLTIFRQCVRQRGKNRHAVIKGFEDEEAPMNTLIAHILFEQLKQNYTLALLSPQIFW